MFDLKSFIIKNRITQVELAQLFSCGQSNISMMERNKSITDVQLNILVEKYGHTIIDKYQSNNSHFDLVKEDAAEYIRMRYNEKEMIDKIIEEKDKRISLLEKFIEQLETENKKLKSELHKGNM